MPRKGYGVETPAGSGFCVSSEQSKYLPGDHMQQRLHAAVRAVFIFVPNSKQQSEVRYGDN